MNDQRDRGDSRLAIPVSIAVVAVVIALGAIVVALRSSPSEPPGTAAPPVSRPATAQSVAPAVAGPAPRAKDQQPSVSKALRRPLRAAQDGLKSGNYRDAIAMLEAVDRTQDKSPYDQHVINVLLTSAYAGVRDYNNAVRVLEAELNDGFLTPSEGEKKMTEAAMLNYQIKNYDKVIEFGSRSTRSGSANPQMATIVAQSYYLKGDWADAERTEAAIVNRQIAAGATPERLSLQMWLSACAKLHDNNCERQALDKLVAYYPTPESQRELDRLRAAR
jgi:hypothetical protein